jgi:hypothetical protein
LILKRVPLFLLGILASLRTTNGLLLVFWLVIEAGTGPSCCGAFIFSRPGNNLAGALVNLLIFLRRPICWR